MKKEPIFKNVKSYQELEELVFKIGINCPEEEISDLMELIFSSSVCKYYCFKETLENGILTAKERAFLENLEGEKLEEYLEKQVRIVQNVGFDPPGIARIRSSRSLQSWTIKIPTALMQIRLRLIKLFLSPLPYKKSYNNSFGSYSKKSLMLLNQTIVSLVETGKFACGFSVKISVSHSGYYLKILRNVLPLPVWLTNRLTKTGNLSVHQLFPETAGLGCLPFLEECILPFWFSELLTGMPLYGTRILHYRDTILVLCPGETELKQMVSALREHLPGYGLDFDYGSFEHFRVRDGFSFLGKAYKVHAYRVSFRPVEEIFDSFLDYINRIIVSPFETLPEKEPEINRIILALNLYFRGFPEEMVREYLYRGINSCPK